MRLFPTRGRARVGDLRARHLSLLSGQGLEIGALHNPARLPAGCSVRYVDKFPLEELRRRNPDVPQDSIVAPDVICDSHSLDSVTDRSADFLVASHVLEHLHNPLAALLDWHRILRPGGRLVCVVPDARYTFDVGRPLTPLAHLLWDYVNDGTELKRLSDLFHIAECNLNLHDQLDVDGAVDLGRTILRETYDTHFHVWTYATFTGQLEALVEQHGLPFHVLDAGADETIEMSFVLEAVAGEATFELDDVPRSRR
jgi:SAM-dependent methyltransferase